MTQILQYDLEEKMKMTSPLESPVKVKLLWEKIGVFGLFSAFLSRDGI